MTRPRFLFTYALDDMAQFCEPLREAADVDAVKSDQRTLEEILPRYDGFLITLGLLLEKKMIERCPKLKLVATCTTGTDHIDVKALEERGIRFISMKRDTDFLSGVSATAEMAWGLLLSVVRNLPWAFDSVKSGSWKRWEFRGRQLRGKTFGILGYGRLGRIVKDMALGFHMRVLAHDVKDFDATGESVEKVDLDTLLRESDALSLHIHLTDENYHFMNRERIAKMKPGAVLLNTSRGAVLDQDALIEALESGRLAGAGVDVLEGEWRVDMSDHPMVKYARTHQNLVISPHIAGTTVDSMHMTMRRTVEKIKAALRAVP